MPCLVHSYLGKETVMGRGDEAVSEFAVLSSREQRQIPETWFWVCMVEQVRQEAKLCFSVS